MLHFKKCAANSRLIESLKYKSIGEPLTFIFKNCCQITQTFVGKLITIRMQSRIAVITMEVSLLMFIAEHNLPLLIDASLFLSPIILPVLPPLLPS